MKKLPYLDGLRGVAILLVFMIHAGGMGLRSLGYIGNTLADHGKYGVTIFFVVSAYTLCMSAETELTKGVLNWKMFFVRRLLRIAPMFYFALALAVVFQHATGSASPGLQSILAHITFANVFLPQYANDVLSVEWSIAVESGFYLLFPLLFLALRNRGGIALTISMLLVIFPIPLVISEWIGGVFFDYRQYTFIHHAYAFIFGLSVFYLNWRCPNFLFLPIILIGVFTLLLLGDGQWSAPIMALITGAAILNAKQDGYAARVLSITVITGTGKISYSLYLLHAFGIAIFGNILSLPITIVVSWVTYKLVEKPFISLAKRRSALETAPNAWRPQDLPG